MFALTPRKELAVRVILITAMLFNAVVPVAAAAPAMIQKSDVQLAEEQSMHIDEPLEQPAFELVTVPQEYPVPESNNIPNPAPLQQVGFPTTAVLDDFNRANGVIGSNWSGSTSGYSISSNKLSVGSGGNIYWGNTLFGSEQEVYVTFTQVGTSATEQDLLLKSQSNTSWTSGLIEVLYDAPAEKVQVWTYHTSQNWVQRGADIPVTFANGDQFGARARADGIVEVYKNGVLLGSRDVSAWPYYSNTGYIGMWFASANGAGIDNFGGGTTTGSTPTPSNTPVYTPTFTATPTPTNTQNCPPTATPTNTPVFTPTPSGYNFPATGVVDDFNRADGSLGSNWSGDTTNYSILCNQLVIESSYANNAIYWNNTAYGPNQETSITFVQVDDQALEQDLILKAQSNTSWGDGILEVLYDAPNHRAQVFTYEWPGGWVQHGSDIPVTFVNGDNFGARAREDGTVEVFRNGELLATREVSSWAYHANGGYIGLWFNEVSHAVIDNFGGGIFIEGTPTPTPEVTSTYTPTFTPTNTLTYTPTPSYTPTSTLTPTQTPSFTPTNTETNTPTVTPTFTSTHTPTATLTPSRTPTFTPTQTATFAPPPGLSCIDWQDGLSQGWVQSPWMDPNAQINWDSYGMHGSATSGITYEVGAYFQMPAGGSYKVLLDGQRLTNIVVTQGPTAPTSTEPLSNNLVAAPDGSYWITDSFLEVRWSVNVPVDFNTTSLFQSFCYSSYNPTSTSTPTVTPSYTATETLAPSGFVASTFDTGDEGWTVVNDANTPVYYNQGGNPGGYVSAVDQSSGAAWFWRAPAKFYGDFSMTYGKTLTFELRQNPFSGEYTSDDVILVGGGIRLVYNTAYNPDTGWTSYSILLHESAGWRNGTTGNAATQAEIQTVLSSLSDLQILGEYRTGPDTGSLDNVVLGNGSGQPPTPTETVTPGPSPTPTNTPSPTLTPTPTLPAFQEMVIPGWIGSPAQQSSVSGVVPITLANGITLQSGTVDYWPINDTSQVEVLATVSNKTGGDTLASLDTTTLANGSYVIRLQGVDGNGVQQDSGIMVTVTGEYKPGRVRFTITDLTIPVVGLPITIARTYDSLERNQVGDFGYGWSLAIGNPKLETDLAHNVTLTMPDGRRSVFYFTPINYTSPFSLFKKPHYTPEAGVYGSLTSNGCDLLVLSGGQYSCFLEGDYQPTEYTYTDPYGRKFVMSADPLTGTGGTLKTITDLNNNVLTFSPDGITSSAGNINVPFVRDGQGRITKITYPAGKEYVYGYDSEGNLETVTFPTVTQPSQQTIVLQYSYYPGDHFFKDVTDPRGNKPVISTYDALNRLESVTDAAGNKTAYEYDLALRKTTIHYLGDPNNPNDNLGDAILIYDQAGYLTNYTDPLGNETVYTYNTSHNLTKFRDPLTHEIQYTYNDQGHPTSIIDPLTHTLGEVDYNQYGGPTTMDTAQGGNATVQYDPVTFMPLSASDNLGALGGYTWTPQGNPETYTDQYGETTSYTYTAQGYVDIVTDPLGHKTDYAYDEFGRVTDVTIAYNTADASTTHYVYDELGRQSEVTVAYGTTRAATTKYEYDANGNRTLVTDPLNRRTKYEYDNANRLILVTYAYSTTEASSTKYVYDIYGRLTDTIMAFGTADESTTHTIYDAVGRKTDVVTAYNTPNASTTHYTYYTDGRVQDVTIAYNTADASTTHYVYDAAGRMTDVTIAYGTTDASTTHYTYYDSGLMRSMTTAYGTSSLAATTNYYYDTRGRSTYTQYPDQTTVNQYYDPMPTTPGWKNSTIDQAGVKTTYIYDAAGRLDQLDVSAVDIQNGQTLHHISNYDYDAADRMTDSFDPMNNHTSFTYYPTGQMHTSTAWLDATTPYTTTYDYNPAGEQISVDDANQHVTQYQYNERGLLKKTIYPLGPGETGCARKGCQVARGKSERAETSFFQLPLIQAVRALATKTAPSTCH